MVQYNHRSLIILVNEAKYIHLLPIFRTLQSFSQCKLNQTIHKFIPILLILLQMLVKLFFSNRIIDILYNLKSICNAKYVLKHFELVCFHIVQLTIAIFCRLHRMMRRSDEKEWKCSKFLRIVLQQYRAVAVVHSRDGLLYQVCHGL